MGLRRAVILVAALNLAYFGVEFAVALAIGSVSLFGDSVDFLEDASINLLVASALGRSGKVKTTLPSVVKTQICPRSRKGINISPVAAYEASS
jgi:hypothetical protein